jgi:hypothetical protein
MASLTSAPRHLVALLAGGLLFVAWLAVDVFGEFQISGLFCLTAVIVAVSASTRWTLIASAAAVTAAAASGLWHDNWGSAAWAVRLAGCAIGCAAATLAAPSRGLLPTRQRVAQTPPPTGRSVVLVAPVHAGCPRRHMPMSV